jgi:hypothetical protein
MRVVDLTCRFSHGNFRIWKYEESELDTLIKKIETVILENTNKPLIPVVEEMLPKIFPDFSDDDVELALEKMYEGIGIDYGIDIVYSIPRELNHLFSNDLEREKQILLYWYRKREALFVNWKQIHWTLEDSEKEIANQRYQDALKGGLFDCDDITFESEEALSKQHNEKGEL